jgi:outer membrane protein assembly factor BamB
MSSSAARRYPISFIKLGLGLACLLAATAAPTHAEDWTQYRGATHDAVSAETGFAKAWEAAEPKVLWKIPIGEGFGTFAVAQKHAFIFVARDGDEYCLKLDADTGKELWAVRIDKTTTNTQGDPCPRSTPTIDGDRVYIFSTYMKLVCLNAADGKVIWNDDLVAEGAAPKLNKQPKSIQDWGTAASPVLDGDLIYVSGGLPGGSLMAFDKKTGRGVWAVGSEAQTHASPVPCTIAGVKQVIFFTEGGLASLEAATGQPLWGYKFPFKTSTAASPVVGGKDGNIVYCSAGYGVGGGAVRIEKQGSRFSATELWRHQGKTMSHWSTPVASGGYLYGIFGFKEFGSAPLACIDMATGKEMWSKPGFGSGGGTILVDNHVLVQSDTGTITLVDASPDGYKEVGHVQPIAKKCWSAAIVANGRIYARSEKEAVCLEVTGK